MNTTRLSAAALFAMSGFCVAGAAAAQGIVTDAYAVDPRGVIVKTPFGLCVRTSSWTREKALRACDPSLFAAEKAAPAPAPAPASSPALVVPPPPPPVVARAADSDNDGVPDTADRCPGTPAGARVDAAGCELDADGDGVVDRLDKCPGTAAGVQVDAAGCAQPVVLKGVNFENNSARLTAGSFPALDAAAATLIKRGDVKVEVAGHTDNRGGAKLNQALSQRRADAVRAYLVSKGVAPANLTSRGYGAEQPIADNKNASGRAANRRVELRSQ
jgi:OOP family OmpA-OmpF porin